MLKCLRRILCNTNEYRPRPLVDKKFDGMGKDDLISDLEKSVESCRLDIEHHSKKLSYYKLRLMHTESVLEKLKND